MINNFGVDTCCLESGGWLKNLNIYFRKERKREKVFNFNGHENVHELPNANVHGENHDRVSDHDHQSRASDHVRRRESGHVHYRVNDRVVGFFAVVVENGSRWSDEQAIELFHLESPIDRLAGRERIEHWIVSVYRLNSVVGAN